MVNFCQSGSWPASKHECSARTGVKTLIVLVLNAVVFFACVSGRRFKELEQAHAEQQSELEQLRVGAARAQSLENELRQTQAQLLKTENALTTFYIKYGNQPSNAPASYAYDDKVQQLEYNLGQLKSELRRKEQELDSYRKDADQLRRTKSMDAEQLQQWESDRKELGELRAKLKSYESQWEQLQKQARGDHDAALRKELAIAKELLIQKDRTIASLNDNLAKASRENSVLSNDLKELQEKAKTQSVFSMTADNNKEALIKIKSDSIRLLLRQMQGTVDSLRLENEKTSKQLAAEKNQSMQLYNDILAKNEQIEVLSKKLSERQQAGKKSAQIQALKDSLAQKNILIQFLQEHQRAERNQHEVQQKNLRDSIKQSFQQIASKISSLELENQQLRNEITSKEQYVQSNASLARENASLKDQNRVLAEQHQRHLQRIKELESRPAAAGPASLPSSLVNRINSLPHDYPQAGVFYKIEGDRAHIYLPQSYLFEGESVAMKDAGTKLISHLVQNLKSLPSLNIELIGFGGLDAAAQRSIDGSFRRANTIGKLMVALGVTAEKLTVGARPAASFNNPSYLPAGIEIIFYAE